VIEDVVLKGVMRLLVVGGASVVRTSKLPRHRMSWRHDFFEKRLYGGNRCFFLVKDDFRASLDLEGRLISPLKAMESHPSISGGAKANLLKFRLEVNSLKQIDFSILKIWCVTWSQRLQNRAINLEDHLSLLGIMVDVIMISKYANFQSN
jgi:hypothetical protein